MDKVLIQEIGNSAVPTFEHLILFDEENLSLGLKKGPFSMQRGLDLAWFMLYARGEKIADLKGIDVFEFLAELGLEKANEAMTDNQMD